MQQRRVVFESSAPSRSGIYCRHSDLHPFCDTLVLIDALLDAFTEVLQRPGDRLLNPSMPLGPLVSALHACGLKGLQLGCERARNLTVCALHITDMSIPAAGPPMI